MFGQIFKILKPRLRYFGTQPLPSCCCCFELQDRTNPLGQTVPFFLSHLVSRNANGRRTAGHAGQAEMPLCLGVSSPRQVVSGLHSRPYLYMRLNIFLKWSDLFVFCHSRVNDRLLAFKCNLWDLMIAKIKVPEGMMCCLIPMIEKGKSLVSIQAQKLLQLKMAE